MARVATRPINWAVLTLSTVLILQPLGLFGSRAVIAQGPEQARGAEQRADPCQRLGTLEPQAQADDVHCLQLGNSAGVARGDFNRDGVADLAIGTPGESIGVLRFVNGSQTTVDLANAGTVTVIFGNATSGLSTAIPPQLIHQDVTGVLDDVEANDKFGAALASGDFNGDGFSDLAVSVPGDNAVQVFKGSEAGLDLVNDSLILGTNFADNQGLALTLLPGLAWGDYNADGYGDLAIEAFEFEGTGVRANVIVMYGSQQFGLQFIGLDIFAFANAGQGGEFQGGTVDMTLAGGDFSGDGADDLAVGLPLADVPNNVGTIVLDGGTVTILQGTAGTVTTGGLSTSGATGLTENNANFYPQTNERFGTTLAVGDFDADGRDDLAVGTPFEDVVGSSGSFVTDGGFVSVFSAGTTLHGYYTQMPFGLNPQAFDNFGGALAAADFNGDGARDLAIASPGDVVNGVAGAGSVTVLYGIAGVGLPRPPSAGLPQINGTSQTFTQDTTDVPDVAESGDHFGATLSAWNFGNGPQGDLVIGAPDEDVAVTVLTSTGRRTVETRTDAGALHVLYGSVTSRLQALGSQFWTQNSTGVPDTVEAGERFGSALY